MIRLPPIGIGCAALAVQSPDTGDEAAEDLLVHAIDKGVRHFDVAPLYGGGRGEVLLGRALSRVEVPVAVSTKIGYVGAMPFGGRQARADRRQDFSRAAIEAGIAGSLRRLNRDCIDVVLLHDPVGHLDAIAGEAFDTLLRLREQGLLRGIGVGTTSVALASAVLDRVPIEYLLLAGRYTLLDRTGRAVIDRCRAMGIQCMAGGVFNSGLLAAERPAAGGNFDYAPAAPEIVRHAHALDRLCRAEGVPLKAAALQFARRQPGVSTTLLGPRTRVEFDELIDMMALPIPEALWDRLDQPAGNPDMRRR